MVNFNFKDGINNTGLADIKQLMATTLMTSTSNLNQTDELRSYIIKAIAIHSPFVITEIDMAYDRLKSFDKVINLMRLACQLGYVSLMGCIDACFEEERKSGRLKS